jgi:hypothetical protein
LPKKWTFCQIKRRTKTTGETKKFYTLTKTLATKGELLFLPGLLLRKDKPILKTYKASHEQNRIRETKPIKTNADRNANQKP